MFEAYRIRPVLEWEGNDKIREFESFHTLNEAVEARAKVFSAEPTDSFEPRFLWTIYGINRDCEGVRTEDAIADVDSEETALALLAKMVGRFHADPRAALPGYYVTVRPYAVLGGADEGELLVVRLTFRISLNLLRQQKRALINLNPGSLVTPDQDEAVEGILNLLDFIQDSILEQGLADEGVVFDTMYGMAARKA